MPTKLTKQTCYEWLREQIVGKELPDTCILWPFGITNAGYGILRMPRDTGMKAALVHRVAYKMVYGHEPQPCGCHSCDVRRCFNPKHVFEGTRADNIADCISKERFVVGDHKGERHGSAKLTEADVLAIRAEVGLSYAQIAMKYSISAEHAARIIHREAWRHI